MKTTKHLLLLGILASFVPMYGQIDTLTIVRDSVSAYTIVYGDNASASAKKSAAQLAIAIQNFTGATLPLVSDTASVREYEIVIGADNNRAACLAQNEQLSNYGYRIVAADKNLIITASDDNHLVLALKHFEKSVLKNKELAQAGSLSFINDSAYLATFPLTQATLANIVKNKWEHSLAQTKMVTAPADGILKVSQGVCTDGTYVYFVIRNTSDSQARIYKYQMSDWSFVAKSEIFNGGHCNDLMYDAPNKRIICIRGGTNGDIKEQSVAIDPETLAYTEGPTIPEGATAIDYNATRKQYITRYGSTINFRDSALAITASSSRTDGYDMTAQGMGTDAEYFYFPMSPKSGENYNILLAYDWKKGHFKQALKIPTSAESESMFEHNGVYYVSYYQNSNGATLYRVDVTLIYTADAPLQEESTLTIDAKGGENTLEEDMYTQAYNTVMTIPNPTREGYTFKGWNQKSSQYISNFQGFSCSTTDSTVFNGTNKYYTLGRSYMYTDMLSINLWAYMDNWGDYTAGMRLYSCTEAGGFNIEASKSTYVNFACYDFGVGYKSATTEVAWADLAPGWHMFTFTFDGQHARGYIDGELKATSKKYVSGEIGYHRTNSLLIGAESYKTARPASTPNYFKGMIRNFGIMHTVLSQEEISLHYQNPGIARFYFPRTDITLQATWIENPQEETNVSNIESNNIAWHIENETLIIEGLDVAAINLFSLSGQRLYSVENSNAIVLNKSHSILIAQITDYNGTIHNIKIKL